MAGSLAKGRQVTFMSNKKIYPLKALILLFIMSCSDTKSLNFEVYETSATGNKLTKIEEFPESESIVNIVIKPGETFQKIIGFGGSFTESSAFLLNQVSTKKQG